MSVKWEGLGGRGGGILNGCDGNQESSSHSLDPLPYSHPRASVFSLTNESYQSPWVVCGSGREKDTRVIGGVPNIR